MNKGVGGRQVVIHNCSKRKSGPELISSCCPSSLNWAALRVRLNGACFLGGWPRSRWPACSVLGYCGCLENLMEAVARIDWARVIVVFGSARELRLSHVAAIAGDAISSASAIPLRFRLI